MLKQGIGLVLLCMAGHAFCANINVTTTLDEVKGDDQCSLREAIEYVNQGLPEQGFNGCGGKESSNIIYLNSDVYTLNSQLTISKSVEIKTQYQADFNESTLGKKNAVIKMTGQDRIFLIDRSLAPKPTVTDPNQIDFDFPINVSFTEVTLEGCSADICSDMGGLIFNKERLKMYYSQLLNGRARLGGAIYNDSEYQTGKAMAHVELQNTLIKGNKAQQGGVLYGLYPQYYIIQSLIRENESTQTGASLFDSKNVFNIEQINTHATENRGIINSTIYNNSGYIIRVVDSVLINNITMILNKLGLIIDAPLNKGRVANSILVQNGNEDCKVISGGQASEISNNLYSVGCAGTASQSLGSVKLIAGTTAEGKCDISSDGILCPLAEYPGYTLPYFKPRLLNTYQYISDSPIVNRGPLPNSNLQVCATNDQRAEKRLTNSELCDRGAVELLVDFGKSWIIGQDRLFGEVGKAMSIADKLHDGELVTPDQCQQIFGGDDNGKPWQPGCLKVVQTNTVSKGSVTIDQEGNVNYTPDGNWDGADQFDIMVISTTTRFTDASNGYIKIGTNIVQRPPNTFEDSKVKTSGGSLGLGTLIVFAGLFGLRRYKK
ncbi:rhombotarget A [Acinetobacter sp. 194]|uniref:rhombotarget A n=1 Tax=Acinetobacter shaoyimingii TaxID=2715164 RepID=UPI001408C47B|nr:rhombotarget A [Acinetobacter shaoyimingii]NHB58474.1 rhombotarget A [Acinetobacter shaoyimingii]